MKIIPKFLIEIKNGEIDTGKIRSYTRFLKNGFYELTIRKPTRVRSIQQNAYFHGVVVQILSDETGIDFFEVKDLLKSLFLKKEIVFMGKTYEIVQHSANLDTIDFNKFVKNVQAFASENGINIPDPKEVDLDHYQTKQEIKQINDDKYRTR